MPGQGGRRSSGGAGGGCGQPGRLDHAVGQIAGERAGLRAKILPGHDQDGQIERAAQVSPGREGVGAAADGRHPQPRGPASGQLRVERGGRILARQRPGPQR